MQIRKTLSVEQSTLINAEVHSGECLLIKEDETVVTLNNGGIGTCVYAYTFQLLSSVVGLGTVLYDDGLFSVELSDLTSLTLNHNGSISNIAIPAIVYDEWNTFVLESDGTDINVRLNTGEGSVLGVAVDQTLAPRTLYNFPTRSGISGILSLWNADVPVDISGNLYYGPITFNDPASTFYPLIENRTATSVSGWLFELKYFDNTARWDDSGLATFDLDTGDIEAGYENPYNNNTLYDVSGHALHGSVSGDLPYSKSFTYSNEYEALLQHPAFSDGYARVLTLNTSIQFDSAFAFEFSLHNLDMNYATIAVGPNFNAVIENGNLKITSDDNESNTYVGDATQSIRFGRTKDGNYIYWVDGDERAVGIEKILSNTAVEVSSFFDASVEADTLYDLKVWLYEDGRDIFEADLHFSGINDDWTDQNGSSPTYELTGIDGLIGDIPGRDTQNLISPIVNGDVPFNVREGYAVYPTDNIISPLNDVAANALDGIGNANDARVYHIVPGTDGYTFNAPEELYVLTFNFVYYGLPINLVNDLITVDENGDVQTSQSSNITIDGSYNAAANTGWNSVSVTFDAPISAGEYKMKTTFSDLRILANPISLAVLKGIHAREGA